MIMKFKFDDPKTLKIYFSCSSGEGVVNIEQLNKNIFA